MAKKPKHIVQSGDPVEPITLHSEEADEVLAEMARLYRERIRAAYNNDQGALQAIADQLSRLKAKLPSA